MIKEYKSTGNVLIDVAIMTFMFCGGFIILFVIDIISTIRKGSN